MVFLFYSLEKIYRKKRSVKSHFYEISLEKSRGRGGQILLIVTRGQRMQSSDEDLINKEPVSTSVKQLTALVTFIWQSSQSCHILIPCQYLFL